MQDLAALRKDYKKATLDVENVEGHPITQFAKWFEEALNAQVNEPNAMHLATVDEQGRPSGRIVLLKGLDNNRFVFFTNYESRKGSELEKNPACSLTFFWPELERQVRIEGVATRTSEERSEAYFQSRPRESQLGAWASPQSRKVEDKAALQQRMKEVETRFAGQAVLPRPKHWGGFEVIPARIEFWQGGPGRMHDRIVYVQEGDAWAIHRVAP
jgi:pyridoxamine 5'-phosphate oxidase